MSLTTRLRRRSAAKKATSGTSEAFLVASPGLTLPLPEKIVPMAPSEPEWGAKAAAKWLNMASRVVNATLDVDWTRDTVLTRHCQERLDYCLGEWFYRETPTVTFDDLLTAWRAYYRAHLRHAQEELFLI